MFIECTCAFIRKKENVKELQKTIKSLFKRTTGPVFNVFREIHSKVFNSVITGTLAVFLMLFLLNVLDVSKTYGEQEVTDGPGMRSGEVFNPDTTNVNGILEDEEPFLLNVGYVVKQHKNQEIIGAFGIRLGQVFNPVPDDVIGTLADGTPLYKIEPNKKSSIFNKYYVTITSVSHKIYSIWAVAKCKDSMSCEKQQNLVINILKKKYGTFRKQTSDDTFTKILEIDQGNKYVIVKCSGFPETSIEIQYHDRELESIAIEELMGNVDDNAIDGSIF